MSKGQLKPAPLISEIDLTKPIIPIKEEEVRKNRGNKGSADTIIVRLDYLQKIEQNLRSKLARPPSRKEIVEQMKLIGFETYNISTMWEDKGKLKTKGKFLSNLLQEGTYSAFQDDTLNLIYFIEEEAVKLLRQPRIITKKITKKDESGETNTIESTETQEAPKTQLLSLLAEVARIRKEFLNGDNVKLSTALLAEEFDRIKDENFNLINRNNALEAELKALMQKK